MCTLKSPSHCNHNACSLPIDLLQSCLMLHEALNLTLMFWFFTNMLVTWFSFVRLKVMEDNELRMWGIWGWGWGNRTCKWVWTPIWQDCQSWPYYKRQNFLEGFIWDYKEKLEILVSIPFLSNNLGIFCTQYTLPKSWCESHPSHVIFLCHCI